MIQSLTPRRATTPWRLARRGGDDPHKRRRYAPLSQDCGASAHSPAARKRAARVAAKSPRDQRWSAFVEFVLQGVLYTNATSQRVASVLATCYLGGPSETTSFPSKPTGAHTCAPLLVSLKDNEAEIIAHPLSCLDFLVLDLERSSGYISTIFGWSSRAPPQVA